jgi:HD-like signal output (HDOD) protein
MMKKVPPPLLQPIAGLFDPNEVVRDLEQLPATPALLPRLLRLLESDSASLDEVIELIRVDLSITARILQMGSSAYYRTSGGPCENVAQAVNRVGFNQVYKLVSYAATAQLLMRPLGAYGIGTHDTWRLAVSCALAAEQLADHIGVNRSLAYTAGLLHGCGMIAIDTWRQQQRVELHFTSVGLPAETTASERAALGFTNADVGAALLRHWEFPPSIVEPVCWQYEPDLCREEPLMACLLHVAKWLRDASHLSDDLPLPPAPDRWILETLRIAPESLETRLYQVRAAFLEASKLLE